MTPRVGGEGDGRVEEGGGSAGVGIVSPLEKFVADACGTGGGFVGGGHKGKGYLFVSDGPERPGPPWCWVVRVCSGNGFGDGRTVGKKRSEKTCRMSEVSVAKEPSTRRMGGIQLARRPCLQAVPFQTLSGVARCNSSFDQARLASRMGFSGS